MIRWLILAAVLLPAGLQAQELTPEEKALKAKAERFARTFAAAADPMTEAECRAERAARHALYASLEADEIKPLELIVEGHRLLCERLRVEQEITRLHGEKARLRAEISKLDAKWEPARVPDYPGRDHSQRLMRADIRGIDKTIAVQDVVSADLHAEALRILGLSVLDTPRQITSNKVRMMSAIDAEAQKSIFDTFRDLLPKVG